VRRTGRALRRHGRQPAAGSGADQLTCYSSRPSSRPASPHATPPAQSPCHRSGAVAVVSPTGGPARAALLAVGVALALLAALAYLPATLTHDWPAPAQRAAADAHALRAQLHALVSGVALSLVPATAPPRAALAPAPRGPANPASPASPAGDDRRAAPGRIQLQRRQTPAL